jgi:hypothetical protein
LDAFDNQDCRPRKDPNSRSRSGDILNRPDVGIVLLLDKIT